MVYSAVIIDRVSSTDAVSQLDNRERIEMQLRRVKILGTGKYLPSRKVTDEELDERLGVPAGWVHKITGVGVRHYVGEGETASYMGARAAEAAQIGRAHV